ncbi:GNAT family N-acetyltransferase [soil metagenome]
MPVMPHELTTERLTLRQFRDDDLDAFAAIQADPVVARHIGDGSVSDRATSWRLMATFLGHWQLRGHGQYAVEERATGAFVGRVGLWLPEGWPGLEIGWLIARDRWGQGYATEAARAVAAEAFRTLPIDRLISLIRPVNTASVRVAVKLGAVHEETIDLDGHDAAVYALRPSAASRDAASSQ